MGEAASAPDGGTRQAHFVIPRSPGGRLQRSASLPLVAGFVLFLAASVCGAPAPAAPTTAPVAVQTSQPAAVTLSPARTADAHPTPMPGLPAGPISQDDWRFQPGTLAWKCPDEMTVATPEVVTASLVTGAGPAAATAVSAPLATASGRGAVGAQTVPITQSMSVELLSEPANAFKIQPFDPLQGTPQDVGSYEQPMHAQWQWEVTPLREGRASLIFRAIAYDLRPDLTLARPSRKQEAGRVHVEVSVAGGSTGDLARSWWWVALAIPVFAVAAVAVVAIVRRARSAQLAGRAAPAAGLPDGGAEIRRSGPSRTRLYDALSERCSLEEIDAFAFELSLDPQDLKGKSRPERAMALIEYFEHRGRLPDLTAIIRQHRPDLEI